MSANSDQLLVTHVEMDLDQFVAQKFGRRSTFMVGTAEGCGCLFTSQTGKARRPLLELLAAYADRGPLDVFLSWEGDQQKEPTLTITLDRSSLAQIVRVLVRHLFMGDPALVNVR